MKVKINQNNQNINSENIKDNELLELIRNNPEKIKEVEQTPDLCKEAVSINGLLLKFIKEQNSDICETAVMNNPEAIRYAKIQSIRMCEHAVSVNPRLIEFAQLQSDNMCKKAINADVTLIKNIKSPSLEIWTRAALMDEKIIKWIKDKKIKKQVRPIINAIDIALYFERFAYEESIKEMDFSNISVLKTILDELYSLNKIKKNEWEEIKEITEYYLDNARPNLGSQILNEIIL